MRLMIAIALRHILARKRQSIVSLLGIMIGVAFFLAISSIMQGSQKDFIRRLVDNAPHITVSDTYRNPAKQPLEILHPGAIVEIRNVKPQTETRGLRGYRQILEMIRTIPGLRASAVLTGQALLSFAGKDVNIVLNGMIPTEIQGITTIDEHMAHGTVDDLIANRDGVIVGTELMRTMSLDIGDNITLAAATGQVRTFKIVAAFRTGRADYDLTQVFVDIKRVQAMMDRPNRANTIIINLDDPQAALDVARSIENRIGYKAVSWQESSEDILNTLMIRNIIMYTVVSAVLVVAAFGIYNIISTIVMEKLRDIAILKSMGFRAGDIKRIFLVQGFLLGLAGIVTGLPLGCVLMLGLGQITFRPPGMEPLKMPIDWSAPQFLIASAFAMGAAVMASWLPARKGAAVLPVNILRGGQ
ncbi:MAG: ABC transporter permease [Micavibrio aeruginosavorus]|nr:ABC transporter permease [Micavibrio aeruginosavorus]